MAPELSWAGRVDNLRRGTRLARHSLVVPGFDAKRRLGRADYVDVQRLIRDRFLIGKPLQDGDCRSEVA